MRVAVLEFLCGGGLSGTSPSTSSGGSQNSISELAQEGQWMLESLASDLLDCNHSVVTCLDQEIFGTGLQLSHLRSGIERVAIAPADNWLEAWKRIADSSDQTIVIAPELDNHLVRIVQWLRIHGVQVLAPSNDFLIAASDKQTTSRLLRTKQVFTPLTFDAGPFVANADVVQPLFNPSEIAGPVTLKRRDGAGCADMKYFANTGALVNWLGDHRNYQSDSWIVQPWHAGQHASLALIARNSGPNQVLGAMTQHIDINFDDSSGDIGEVVYRGGTGPVEDIQYNALIEFADRMMKAMPGRALGWVGIDFLIPSPGANENEWIAIEINPRLTTSYLGYRAWYGAQLANSMLNGNPLRPQSKREKVTFGM
ncbi:MAG: ATP-grasp domain-containing protein [Pirellula sp.]